MPARGEQLHQPVFPVTGVQAEGKPDQHRSRRNAESDTYPLIDTYGGLTTAIAIAADKAELGDDYRIAEIFDEPTNLPLLFRMFGAKIRTSFSLSELGEAMQTYGRIQEAVSQQGVVMYCPYRLDLQ